MLLGPLELTVKFIANDQFFDIKILLIFDKNIKNNICNGYG